jgi:hypothetical protein
MNETEAGGLKVDAVQNWLKTQPKIFFGVEFKKRLRNSETSVLKWGGGGELCGKVILVSFLYMYNKCAFF